MELFSKNDQQQIVAAIKKAELNTSGEVRVHIDKKCKHAVLDRAAFVFDQLEMQRTAQRNGVLFYLAIEDRKFAILGDVGINQKVEDGFWDGIKDGMQAHFKKGDFVLGLSEGIAKAGNQLKQYFPYQSDDVNELPDEISLGNE